MEPYLLHPNEELIHTFDFSADVPVSVTVQAVSMTVPSPLVAAGGSLDTLTSRYAVRISGAVHGVTYHVVARAQLSNTEFVSKVIAIRGHSSV